MKILSKEKFAKLMTMGVLDPIRYEFAFTFKNKNALFYGEEYAPYFVVDRKNNFFKNIIQLELTDSLLH